jgi:diguanylate cyclase (GGDEF)-like protein
MKIFLERNKTLLPRVDIIYLVTRVMTFMGIVWFVLSEYRNYGDPTLFYVILGTFVLHLAVFIAAILGRFDIKLAYLSAVIYDMFLIPTMILNTGGLESSYYLLFYLTVSVAAYVLVFWFATAITIITTIIFIVSVHEDLVWANALDISIRLGFIWVYYLTLSYAMKFTHRSERRLLKLFDTLNMRTSELEKSQAQLEMIYENTRVLASILDAEGVIREVMRIMGSILQYSNYCIILKDRRKNIFFRARSIDSQVNYHPKPIGADELKLVKKVFSMGEAVTINSFTGHHDYVPLSPSSRSLIIVPMTSHGQINGVLLAEANAVEFFNARDLQMLSAVARSAGLALENAELHRKTEELTIIDELTGIYNYRYFVQKLKEEKRRALRYDLPLSLIMVDIDWFKKLNDSYGHEIGNEVLRQLANVIRRCIRDVDIFCRYGGEEFVIILPQTPKSEASHIGERIRSQVEQEIINTGNGNKVKITVSVGVSSFPENGKSHEELVSIADQALYRAKGDGRNLVCVI